MRIGLDFGTTNSSAVFYKDGELKVLPSNYSEASGILPSLIYIAKKDYETLFGRAAALRYLRDDTGRLAQWETYHAGVLSYWIGTDPEPTLVTEDIWLQNDIGARGRLLQSVKTALRSRHYVGTSIFNRFFTVEDLLSLILQELHQGAEKQLQKKVDSVLLGRPVKFSDDIEIDRRAQIILRDAALKSGFEDVKFMAEPIAAAYSYHIKLDQRCKVMVFDFGGGTLDLTVMDIGGKDKPQVISTEGVLIGGDDFDQKIMETFLWKYFGYGIEYKGNYHLPPQVYDILLSWSRHPDLTRGDFYFNIQEAVREYHRGPEFKALLCLINNKLGFHLFEEIEKTKIALSEKNEAILSFNFGDVSINERITRNAFSKSIDEFIVLIDKGIDQVLQKAQLKEDNIDLVLCTGGSSAVTAVMDLLTNRFSPQRIRQHERFLGVSTGLAVAASFME